MWPFPREIVICAAVKFKNGYIVRGHRHNNCFDYARNRPDYRANSSGGMVAYGWREDEQGFITSRNRFVGREEGLRLQLAAGIKSASPDGYRSRHLFSEDLY